VVSAAETLCITALPEDATSGVSPSFDPERTEAPRSYTNSCAFTRVFRWCELCTDACYQPHETSLKETR
jgi:hypothetical protein